jgi:hypothetical protein
MHFFASVAHGVRGASVLTVGNNCSNGPNRDSMSNFHKISQIVFPDTYATHWNVPATNSGNPCVLQKLINFYEHCNFNDLLRNLLKTSGSNYLVNIFSGLVFFEKPSEIT